MRKQNRLSPPDVVTVEELAGILGIGRNQAYQAVKSGRITSLRIGKRYLIPRKIVAELLEPKPKEIIPAVLPVLQTEATPFAHRASRGGARLSSEQLNEFSETVSSLSDALRDIGDMVMRLRRLRDELIKRSRLP